MPPIHEQSNANAGIRRPRRRQPGETAARARAFRFMEVALSPRVLLIGGGLAFMVRAGAPPGVLCGAWELPDHVDALIG